MTIRLWLLTIDQEIKDRIYLSGQQEAGDENRVEDF